MKRNIIRIDESKCNGCGLCVPGCKEGALQIIDGKARLVSEVYCDGLGGCLGDCPQGALTIEERDAPAFDEAAVAARMGPAAPQPHGHAHDHGPAAHAHHHGGGCPGSAMRMMQPPRPVAAPAGANAADAPGVGTPSQLGQWPVQLMLVPPHAPYLKNADLVICADCVPFVCPDLHQKYLTGRAVLVGCPKLDDLGYYREKLEEVFRTSQPRRITVLRMEVPCCSGIAHVAKESRDVAVPQTPFAVHTYGIQGGTIAETEA